MSLKNFKPNRLASVYQYDTIKEFNVDSKVECDQLNLAHETKTNNRQCPSRGFLAAARISCFIVIMAFT